jgi:MFS family permease
MSSAVVRRFLVEAPRPARVRNSPRAAWLAVASVCVGAFMGQLDASIVTVALPRIGTDLHAGVGAVEWVSLAYLLVLVGTLAAVGRLADRFGRKLLYVHGFAVFTAGSLLCGLAPSLGWLVAARVLQGLGAALLQANGIALIRTAVPDGQLGRALGFQATFQALGLGLGPAIGGALLALGGWRLLFLVNVPAGAFGWVLGSLLLPRTRFCARTAADTRLPLELRLLADRRIGLGLAGALASFTVMFGALVATGFSLASRGVPAATAGFALAALPVALGVVAPLAGRLADRGAPSPLPVLGLPLAGVGLAIVALWPGWAGVVGGLVVAGAGLGAFIPANNAMIVGAAPSADAGVLSGLLSMTRALGTALGVAVASAVYADTGLTASLLVLAAVAALAGPLSAAARSRPAR